MLDKIADTIMASDTIAILPHVFADGDALGSSFALALALAAMGKKADVLLEEEVPLLYDFLPGRHLSNIHVKSQKQYDLALALDCGDMERLGRRKEVFDRANRTVNIDHHNTNNGFAIQNHVDTASSSTGEIIFVLLGQMGHRTSPDIAVNLYVAISTDTGGFRYSNTTPLTHKIVSELISQGVEVAELSRTIFDTASYEKVKLTGAAIQSLALVENSRIAVMTLTNEMISSTGAREEDSEGIINIARNIRGVEAAVMLRELNNGDIKVNLRSNKYVDVSVIAGRYSGGGHKRAAGFTTTGDLTRVKVGLLDELRKEL